MESLPDSFINALWRRKQFRDAAGRSATRAQRRGVRTERPRTDAEYVATHLARIKEVTDRTDPAHRERGVAALIRLLSRTHVMREDTVPGKHLIDLYQDTHAYDLGYTPGQTAHAEVGLLTTHAALRALEHPLEAYFTNPDVRRHTASRIVQDQRSQLATWVRHLTGDSVRDVPDVVRYWFFAELLGLGSYDRARHTYSKRTKESVASLPEHGPHIDQLLRSVRYPVRLAERYAEAERVAHSASLPAQGIADTRGTWRRFKRGTAPQALVEQLAGKSTRWCIARAGSAASYLNDQHLQIYFSRDAAGKDTIPRACIAETASDTPTVTEVRGVVNTSDFHQHVDRHIRPIVDAKLKETPHGAGWLRRMQDMELLSAIHVRSLMREPLTQKELRFLYELDRPISFRTSGKDDLYDLAQDERVALLRATRTHRVDLSRLLGCAPHDVATAVREITPDTKAYVGPIEPHLFSLLDTRAHVYTPQCATKLHDVHLHTRGAVGRQLIHALSRAGVEVYDLAGSTLRNATSFEPAPRTLDMHLVRVRVSDLGFDRPVTESEIAAQAALLGLRQCGHDVASEWLLAHGKDALQYWHFFSTPTLVSRDKEVRLSAYRNNGQPTLHAAHVAPQQLYNPSDQFFFRRA